MTRTLNHPPLEEAVMSSVTMMSKVFLPPSSSKETLSSRPQTPNLPNCLPRAAHNRNHPVAKALSKTTLLLSPTTTPTPKINTMVRHTTRATVFHSRSSSIPPCSNPVLPLRAQHRPQEASKAPARCSPSRTIMVVDFTVNNTSSPRRPTTISDTSTTRRSTITHKG